MPTYSYICDDCGHVFEDFHGMSEDHPSCPECGADYGDEGGVRQDYSATKVALIEYGNPTTFGQQAELNAKRMGKERMQQMSEEAKNKIKNMKGTYTGPTGRGKDKGTINKTPDETPFWREEGSKPLDVTQIKDKKKYIMTGEAN